MHTTYMYVYAACLAELVMHFSRPSKYIYIYMYMYASLTRSDKDVAQFCPMQYSSWYL